MALLAIAAFEIFMTSATAANVGEGDGTVHVNISRTLAEGTVDVICYTADGLYYRQQRQQQQHLLLLLLI